MSLNLEEYAGKKTEYPVVDAGKYEVVLNIKKKWSKDNSTDYGNCDFFIRNDKEATDANELNAKWKGSHVFEKIYRDKVNPEWFNLSRLGELLVTQKNKKDYRTIFDELDELIQFLNGRTLVVEVEKKYDDYFQKEVNVVKQIKPYSPSTLGDYVSPEKATATVPTNYTEAITVDDNDLPF